MTTPHKTVSLLGLYCSRAFIIFYYVRYFDSTASLKERNKSWSLTEYLGSLQHYNYAILYIIIFGSCIWHRHSCVKTRFWYSILVLYHCYFWLRCSQLQVFKTFPVFDVSLVLSPHWQIASRHYPTAVIQQKIFFPQLMLWFFCLQKIGPQVT